MLPEVWILIDKPSGKGFSIDKVVLDPLQAALKEITDLAEKEIKPAYSWWQADHQPKWKIKDSRAKVRAKKMQRTMYTDDTPYLWVTGGTKVSFAVFAKGYRPATSPNVIGRTGPGGSPVRTAKQPTGKIEARNFEDVVVSRVRPKMDKIVMRHVVGGIAGHFWGPQKYIRARIL